MKARFSGANVRFTKIQLRGTIGKANTESTKIAKTSPGLRR